MKYSITIVILFAALASLILWKFGYPLFSLFGLNKEAADIGFRYILICIPFYLIFGLQFVLHGYLNGKKHPSRKFMTIFYIACIAVIFVGALVPMDFAWTMADITMGGMTLINIPCCLILSGIAIKALRDFESQKKRRLNPTFRARNIGLDESKMSCWTESDD